MGKRGKKLETEDNQPLPKEIEREDDITNVLSAKKKKKSRHSISFEENSASNSNTDLQSNVGKKTKSDRKRALNGNVTDSVPAFTNDYLENATVEVKKKKNKKIKIASDPEVNDKEGNEEINSTTDSPMKKKKKNKYHSLLVEENKPDIQIELKLETESIKKKKKIKIASDSKVKDKGNEEMNSKTDSPKKKKKKNKDHSLLAEENKPDIQIELNQVTESIKRKKKIVVDSNETVEKEIPNNDNFTSEKTKTKKKKNKSKIARLNDEEAQVTEEDIDRFCAELGAEDNLQFEEWVQQLEASLPPRRTAK